jgi:hypothetical protein
MKLFFVLMDLNIVLKIYSELKEAVFKMWLVSLLVLALALTKHWLKRHRKETLNLRAAHHGYWY